jgi:oxygen-dependent protoporphyrinogen oxidase
MKNEFDAIIVGAGISGLTTSYFLEKKGMNVLILEKKNEAGGSISSRIEDDFIIDLGPNTVLETTPLFKEIAKDLDIHDRMIYASDTAKKRYILKNGKLVAIPTLPPAFIKTGIISLSAKLRVLKEPFIPPYPEGSDETLTEFVTRRFGAEFLKYIIDPFVAGVYAGSPEKLSVNNVFPKLREMEQKYGSLIKAQVKGARERKRSKEKPKTSAPMFSFKGGLEEFTDGLAKKFRDNIKYSATIRYVKRNEHGFEIEYSSHGERYSVSAQRLIYAVPAYELAEMNFFEPIAAELKKIYYPPVALVFAGYKENHSAHPLDGYGFLTPSAENRKILGCLWTSAIFPERAPSGGAALTVFVGGSRQPELAILSEDNILDIVKSELKEIMGISVSPDYYAIKKYEKAIPQYALGHEKIISTISDFEIENNGLYITGNFRGGISVADCVKSSKMLADKIE